MDPDGRIDSRLPNLANYPDDGGRGPLPKTYNNNLSELRTLAREIKSSDMAGNQHIYFKGYASDGCFARASIIANYLREKGFKVNYAYANHPKMPGGDGYFAYHIAACVEIDGENYVVDPIYNHEGPYSGLSKFSQWLDFQEPLNDISYLKKSDIYSGYDSQGNPIENFAFIPFYKNENRNKLLTAPEFAEKLLKHYKDTYNPQTKHGDFKYEGF